MTADQSLPLLAAACMAIVAVAVASSLRAKSIHLGLTGLALAQVGAAALSAVLGAMDLALSIAALGVGAAVFALAAGPEAPAKPNRWQAVAAGLAGAGLLATAALAFGDVAPFHVKAPTADAGGGIEALALIGAAFAVLIAAPTLTAGAEPTPKPPGPIRTLATLAIGLPMALFVGSTTGAAGLAVGALFASGALLYALAVGGGAVVRALPRIMIATIAGAGLLVCLNGLLGQAGGGALAKPLNQGLAVTVFAALIAIGLPAIAARTQP
jgi:hypothetical protein